MSVGEERFANFFANLPAATLPLSTEPMLVLQGGLTKQTPVGGGSGSVPITIGGTPTIGGTNECIIFDKAGVVGEDTGLEWNYTSKFLSITVPNNSQALNFADSIHTFQFFVGGGGGTLGASMGTVTNHPFAFFSNNNIVSFGLSNNGNPTVGNGNALSFAFSTLNSNFTPDIQLARQTAGVLGQSAGLISQGFFVYNTADSFQTPTNYERGVFDWTTTSNVLTIGTQNGGSGTLRAVQLVGASITAQNASLSVAADTGGIASTNTISSANSTTISTGTGTVKMSSANNANNTGWLKCYIGTQVAWIPCWTTNAP